MATKKIDQQDEWRAFRVFAKLYPHEAHKRDPDMFWRFFQEQCPGVSREEMQCLLRDTDMTPPVTTFDNFAASHGGTSVVEARQQAADKAARDYERMRL